MATPYSESNFSYAEDSPPSVSVTWYLVPEGGVLPKDTAYMVAWDDEDYPEFGYVQEAWRVQYEGAGGAPVYTLQPFYKD